MFGTLDRIVTAWVGMCTTETIVRKADEKVQSVGSVECDFSVCCRPLVVLLLWKIVRLVNVAGRWLEPNKVGSP